MTWIHWAAITIGIIIIIVVIVYFCARISGEIAQWEEDTFGIRRS